MEYLKSPLFLGILVATLLIAQASWIFWDAGKRGERRLLWAIFGLLNVPSSLVIYLLVTRLRPLGKVCSSCGKRVPKLAKFCPECGSPQDGGGR